MKSFCSAAVRGYCSSLILALLACSALGQTSTTQGVPQRVSIGYAGPMTGPVGHLVRGNAQSAQLAIEEVNKQGLVIGGRPTEFELIVEDDAANSLLATQVANTLVAKRVAAVIGHLNSEESIHAAKIYSKSGIPMLSPGATDPKLTRMGLKGVFRLVASEQQVNEAFGAHAARKLALRTVFVIDDRWRDGKNTTNAFTKGFQAAGGKVVDREVLYLETRDIARVVERIALTKADAVFLGGTASMDRLAAILFQQMRDKGLTTPLLGSSDVCSVDFPEFVGIPIERGKVLCADGGGSTADREANAHQFNQRFTQRFRADPLFSTQSTYDAVHVLVAAMLRANSVLPSEFLRQLFLTDHNGVSARIRFNQFGDLLGGPVTLFSYADRELVAWEVLTTPE